jgi:hypothetical protein
MPELKLNAVTAVATALVLLPAAPTAVAGPWLAPWVLAHAVRAAARLATLPMVAASTASSAAQPVTPAPYRAAYAAPPAPYASSARYGPPGYYAPPPGYCIPPPGYYSGPQRYYPPAAYRGAIPYGAGVHRPEPLPGYSVPGMRYSDSYGRAVYSRSRGLAYRHW